MSKASQIRQRAQEFLSKGQTDKAIQEYRRLISIESKNPNLYNELGDIFLRAGDKAQAVQNFEKAAVIYEKVALYNNAVAVCKKILRIEPEKADTVFKLAELRAKQKLEGEAITYFTQYVELVFANPTALLQRSQKNVERILELMGANEPILAKAAEVFEQLGLKLKTVELYAKLSTLTAEKGDAKKQVQYRRKAEELAAGLSPEELTEMNKILEGRGNAAEPVAAGASGESAGVEAPREAAAPQTPVDAAEAAGDAPAAGETRSREALEDEPPAEEANDADVESGVDEAVEEAEMVAAMSGGTPAFAVHASADERGRSSVSGTPPSSEAAVATETPPVRPGPAPTSEPPAARHADEQGSNLAEEITSDVEKDDFQSHYDLGMAYLEMGLYTEAIKDFQIASRCQELQLSSMEMIGYCFLKHDQPRLAVKQLTHALEIAKGSGAESLGIHYNLGMAFEMLGEVAPAREHFEEVYIIDMTFRDVADKMKKLNAVS